MITDKRKLPAMHEVYGKRPDRKCRHCCNLISHRKGRDHVHKCKAYGDTYSGLTDWGLNFMACGLFNIPFLDDIPLFHKLEEEGTYD